MSSEPRTPLNDAYDALIAKYNQTRGIVVNAERLSLLSTLYNLELKTRDESYVTSSDDTKKSQTNVEKLFNPY